MYYHHFKILEVISVGNINDQNATFIRKIPQFFLCIISVDAGKCLQDAQRLCLTQSAGLIQAVRERKAVCR